MTDKRVNPNGAVKLKDFYKLYSMITFQAEMKAITWSRGKSWGLDEQSLRKLRVHKKRIEENMSRLEAWAGRVKPKGDVLLVARYLYSQYKRELSENAKALEMVSLFLDQETEVK